jgi:Type I restriction modification DNA specificity domain.
MKLGTIGDLIELKRGTDLTRSEMIDGNIPVAGSNGVIGYHNSYTTVAPGITVGRSGSVGKVHYFTTNFWAHNTALFVANFKGNEPRYIYYLLKSINLEHLCGSSVVPSLNRNFVHPLKITYFESPHKQRQIAAVLSSLDSKIELNNRINDNLPN